MTQELTRFAQDMDGYMDACEGGPWVRYEDAVAAVAAAKPTLSQAGQGGQGEVVRETDIYDFAGWLTTRPGVLSVGSSLEAGPMAEAVGEYIKTFPKRFAAQPAPVPAPVVQSREAREAAQRERMSARLSGRPNGPATADFDLPAPNDHAPVASVAEPMTRAQVDDLMTEFYPLDSLLSENVDHFEKAVRAVEAFHRIGQQPAPAVPAGWQLVPVEPTPEMLEALATSLHASHRKPDGYRAMLSAAPKPEAGGQS